MNIELQIFIVHEGMCPLPACSVFCTAWVRNVLYKNLNLLAAFCNNTVIVDIKMGLFLQIMSMVLAIMMVSLEGWVPLGCLEEERVALLHLKDSLNYPNGTSLPSWRIAHANCCDWDWYRITCNSSTGTVWMARSNYSKILIKKFVNFKKNKDKI